MYAPVPIRSTLLQPHNLERLRCLLVADPPSSRWAATIPVCEAFDFRDARQRLRRRSCLTALEGLDQAGLICLPAPQPRARRQPPPAASVSLPPVPALPPRVDRLAGLAVQPVGSASQLRLWQQLMAREHPLGPVRAVGCQLRYLLTAEPGLLGGFLFAAATRRQRARDRWIGWTPAQCAAGRHRLLGLARFLLRPAPRSCHNLASKALALCLRRVADDFATAYGFAPVLVESYVGPGHAGASYRAAGWQRVGHTAGRARDGSPVPVKAVYLRPLCRHWRDKLGVRLAAMEPWAGLDSETWAAQEFGQAPFGDSRLVQRLVLSAQVLARAPARTFFTVARGQEALMRGYYRFIEHPDAKSISAETILQTHRRRTQQRLQGQQTVLLVQDGTDLNLATHQACQDLGMIGRNKGSAGTLGLHLHSTLAVSGEGLPLGVVRMGFDAPSLADGRSEAGGAQQQAAPTDAAGKIQRWVEAVVDSGQLVRDLRQVRAIAVMDREGDAFEVFHAWRGLQGRVELLVRAKHNRSLGPRRHKLFDRLRVQPAKASLTVSLQRQSQRRAARGQKAFAGRAARTAACQLRWARLQLPVPAKKRRMLGDEPIRFSAVHVAEPEPPADGSDPLEWLLLTSLAVHSAEQAREILRYYKLRWRIEDWHRILKHGCRVERIAHRKVHRVQREVAVRGVIAWRLHVLALLGRDTPELEAQVLFSEYERMVLADFARSRGVEGPANLGRAMKLVWMMGGYLDRKHDPAPGQRTVWEGYTYLQMGTAVLRRACEAGLDSEVGQYWSTRSQAGL